MHACRYTRQGHVCRQIHGIRREIDEVYTVAGRTDWADPPEVRLDFLTDEFVIGFDCLEVGPWCWYDRYFQSWLVFDPGPVARSRGGDHAWVSPYLGLDKTPWPVWAGDYPWRPPGHDGPLPLTVRRSPPDIGHSRA